MRTTVQAILGVSALAAATPALAQTAAPTSVESIVVTAERTNRSLKDTASSVAVITAADGDRMAALQSTYDILDLIPNVVAPRTANMAPAIRGIDGGGPAIGANAFFAGTRPRVAFLVDGRALTFNEAIYLDGGIWDMQQTEVYRGPQSTLQGRNAVGGVIAVKTADPTFEMHGKARLLVGEDNLRQISGALGGPLIPDVLAFRIAADHREEEAFVKTRPFVQLGHPDAYRSDTVRGKLLFTPTPEFRTLTTLSYTNSFSPQTLSVKLPFTDYVATATNTPRFQTRALVAISDSTWKLSDDLALSAFLTATDFKVNRYVNPANGIAEINGREYTAEPRIRFGQASDRLSGFLAAFIFRSSQDEVIDLFGGGTFDDKTVTKAIFGETTWRAADRLDVTLGARYEEEKRDRVGSAGRPTAALYFPLDYHETFKAFLPRGTVKYRLDEAVTVGATVGKGYNSGGAGFAFNPPYPSFVYGKETVWNYEAFIRSSLMGGRLNLNGNVFYNDYKGLQLPYNVAVTAAGASTIISNAEKATTYGAEAELRFRATDWLDLTGGGGLLKTKINRYSDPSIEGRELPRSPAYSLSAGFIARPIENLDASMSFRWTDAYYSDVFNLARGKTKAHGELNAQLGYTIGHVRVFGQVVNLLDEQTPESITPATNPASDIANMSRPRRFMAGVSAAF
jgi:outer membrane receptor protein involved in Fe transport